MGDLPAVHEPLNLYRSPEHLPFIYTAEPERGVGALLIHGFMGSPREFRPIGELLKDNGINAHATLLPGFGAGINDLGTQSMTSWLTAANAAWADLTSRYRRTVLIGFSMGGAVALHVAAQRPPDRLILLAPLYRIADRRAVALPILKRVVHEFRPFADANFHRPVTRENFELIDPSLDIDDPALQARIRREFVIPTTALDQLRVLALKSARAGRKAITPTLVIQGSDDRVVRRSDTRRLLSHLGGVVSYAEVPCDHMLVLRERSVWPRVQELILQHVTPLLKQP